MDVALISLHWFSEFKGGAERAILETYKLLSDAVNYKIIAGYYHAKQNIPQNAYLIQYGERPLVMKHLKFYRSTKQILEKIDPDLVHSNNFSSPVHNPQLLDVHQFEYTPEEPWPSRSPLFRFMRNAAIKRSDAILAHTNYVKGIILKEVKVQEEKIHVIPYATDPEMLNPDVSLRKMWRVRLGLNGKLVFYYPARIIPSKSQDLLLKSLRFVKKDVLDNSYFIMSGMVQDEGYYKKLLLLAKGLPASVISDPLNVISLYAASDVVLSSTMHYETFGKIVTEGMAMKKPLLLPNLSVFKEVSKGNAVFFKSGDMNDLANKIEQMYHGDELRKDLRERGIKIVNEFYNPEMYKKRLLALYEAIQ
jgi:glycosyltransferase involved in cell wall biosynthesis